MPPTYGTEISFRLGPGHGEEARAIAERLCAAALDCTEHVLFADDEAGEYGCLAVWATDEAAVAFRSSPAVADELEHIEKIAGKPSRVRSYLMEYQRP